MTFNQKVLASIDLTTPKVPIDGKRNILVTSALPYVNNLPHLGNIIGCILSGDAYARFCRLRGHNAIYICGTDEYGTATETKALEEKISPKELCDKYFKLQSDVYKWFQIDFDYFGRTTTEEQTKIAQDIFQSLQNNSFLNDETVEQLFCVSCERFLADRFVEGECPVCHYQDARGDQCDKCGQLIDAVKLINPRCKIDGNTPIIKQSQHLFLDLSRLQGTCENFVTKSSNEGVWSRNAINITNAWLKEGLKPRCITRDLKWGTPVPGMDNKVFYVWFDAPIGYISITANYTSEWKLWWKNPDNVELYQFMGKDNVPFHSVIFPCSLLGTGETWTLLKHLNATEYLNYENTKFSKSRNVGVFGNNARESGIPVSVWRYVLLANRPETSDTSFNWDDLLARNNSELLSGLGNLINRVLKFTKSKYSGILPDHNSDLDSTDQDFVTSVNEEFRKNYLVDFEAVKIRSALKSAMTLVSLGNAYISQAKLDNALFLNDPLKCARVINISLNLLWLLSACFYPFIPEISEKLCEQLNVPLRSIPDIFVTEDIKPGHKIGEPYHLFERIDQKAIDALRKKYSGIAQ